MRALRLLFLVVGIGALLAALALFFRYQQKKHACGNALTSHLAQAEELTLTEHDPKHNTSYTLHAKQGLVDGQEQIITCKQATLHVARDSHITATVLIAQAQICRTAKKIVCSEKISGSFEHVDFKTTSCVYSINTHKLTMPTTLFLVSKNMLSEIGRGTANLKDGSFEGAGGIKTTIIF
jgi:hypothetical protein